MHKAQGTQSLRMGDFGMTGRIAAIFAALTFSAAAAAEDLHGVWRGVLATPAGELRIEMEIGEETAVLVSVDQGGARIEASEVDAGGVRFHAAFPSLAASYEAELDAGRLDGVFTQGGAALPLALERGRFSDSAPDAQADPADIEMTVQSQGRLAGSLRLPDGQGPFPAVLLLNGSGSQDRDATVAGQPVFAVLAQALAEAGFASLRLDDRGVGGSEAVAPESPRDLAADAAAALSALRSRDETDPACVGVLGHSEGGLVAFLAAEAGADPAFIVTLAAPAATMRETLFEQAEALNHASGATGEQIAANRALQQAVFTAMEASDAQTAPQAIAEALEAHGLEPDAARQQGAVWGQAYALAALDLDPAPAMAGYRGPVAALLAGKDLQVPPDQTAARIEAARAGLETRVEIVQGVNHLFQDAESGLPSEYAASPHAIAPQSLETITAALEELTAQGCPAR